MKFEKRSEYFCKGPASFKACRSVWGAVGDPAVNKVTHRCVHTPQQGSDLSRKAQTVENSPSQKAGLVTGTNSAQFQMTKQRRQEGKKKDYT